MEANWNTILWCWSVKRLYRIKIGSLSNLTMVEEASDKFLPVVPFLEEVNPVWLNYDTFLMQIPTLCNGSILLSHWLMETKIEIVIKLLICGFLSSTWQLFPHSKVRRVGKYTHDVFSSRNEKWPRLTREMPNETVERDATENKVLLSFYVRIFSITD